MKLIPNYDQLGAKFDRTEPGLFPGGGTIALRGPKVKINDINITEEEDSGNDVLIEKPEDTLPSNAVNPKNTVPSQPVAPQNSPSNSSPSQPSNGRFF
jgi:hypothetical protein